MSTIVTLEKAQCISPPKWLPCNVMYETIMGSVAYGVSSDTSDMDVYGFCIPKKEILFPHTIGVIYGFGHQGERFEQFQQHHVNYNSKVYDITIYNITKYFQLLMENNPNIIDSIFTPINCVLHSTKVGHIVRDNRKIFLHKGCWHKFKGYAYSQLHKMSSKNPIEGSNRELLRQEFGFDVKFGYHVVRLIEECKQILEEGDLDLQRNNEQLKAIRRGEVSEKEIRELFTQSEKQLSDLYVRSKLRYKPDEQHIKQILLQCLEEHFGSLANTVTVLGKETVLLNQIKTLLENYTVHNP